ncbi:luciferase family protein [Streptomyces sp. NRRL B-1347]|uniref:luciferase domain-containing protein n=1 Tax=Streptomyces sp. NRRL B-1347 TaxID=1476877 RepID=UPI00131AF06C|nr:luciferase family protein [Streptomyces sp. NRRL B-1347]
MTAAQRAMTQLESWPNLVSGSPRCAVGRCFGTPGPPGTAGYELVHFHSDDAADVCLTRAAVDRLRPQLAHSSAIRVRPGASWITVLLDCDMDVALLLTLVSVGLKAHDDALALIRGEAQQGRPADCPSPPCDWEARDRTVARAAPTAAAPPQAATGRRGLRATWKAFGRLIPHGH